MSRVLFVMNPAAGVRGRSVMEVLSRLRNSPRMTHEIALTTAPGDAERIAADGSRAGFDIVAAVGGDGTVNEVGRGLLAEAGAQLAIIPTGSGNGVARHLRIPLQPLRAIERLLTSKARPIDVGYINGHAFLCTAGVGFDARVSRYFADRRIRGLVGYASAALMAYSEYRSTPIKLELPGSVIRNNCFVLAFANASQYGNNALIAPLADMADGRLDLCLIDELPLRRALRVAVGLAVGDLPRSRAATYMTARSVVVRSERPLEFHADGDFLGEAAEFKIKVERHRLSVRA